jgi:N-acetylmuramoyl-L-alanine amidase
MEESRCRRATAHGLDISTVRETKTVALDRLGTMRARMSAVCVVVALFAALVAHTFPVAASGRVSKPHVVWKPIPFGPKRKREMAAYSKRHYGAYQWRLLHPHVVVEHFTGGNSFSSAWNTFAANSPDLGELPGTCAHFIIDRDGTIYQLVHLGIRCRHTVGLNYTAFGIEHVGTSDQEILNDRAQIRASLRLTLWLMDHYGIQLRNVIGHNESLMSPYHHELYPSWRCQTHSDWNHADMTTYRRMLKRLAQAHGVPIGPPPQWVHPNC